MDGGDNDSVPTVVFPSSPIRPMTSSPKRLTLANIITIDTRVNRTAGQLETNTGSRPEVKVQQRDGEVDRTDVLASSPITGATHIRHVRRAGNGRRLVD